MTPLSHIFTEEVIVLQLGQLLHLLHLPELLCAVQHVQLGHLVTTVEVHPGRDGREFIIMRMTVNKKRS